MAFTLPRLGAAGFSFGSADQQQIWWQQVVEKIEAQEASQDEILADIQALQAEQADMLTQLADQLAQIIAAQATATAAAREAARIASYPNPGVGILSASDAGTDASIAVAGHVRVYPVRGSVDVPDVAITAGSITGLSYSTRYYVYYDDTTLADTTPTFLATTASAQAQVGAATGRHFVGYVDTPAAGTPPTTGGGGSPPGGGGGGSGGAIP